MKRLVSSRDKTAAVTGFGGSCRLWRKKRIAELREKVVVGVAAGVVQLKVHSSSSTHAVREWLGTFRSPLSENIRADRPADSEIDVPKQIHTNMCAVHTIGLLLYLCVSITSLHAVQVKSMHTETDRNKHPDRLWQASRHALFHKMETISRERFLKTDTDIQIEVLSVAGFETKNSSVRLSAADEATNSSAFTPGPAAEKRPGLTSAVLIAIFLFVMAFALVYCAMTVCTSGQFYCLPRNGG
jgi:hypothetical protein